MTLLPLVPDVSRSFRRVSRIYDGLSTCGSVIMAKQQLNIPTDEYCGKIRHYKRVGADEQLIALARWEEVHGSAKPYPLTVYFCDQCRAWHVGHDSQAKSDERAKSDGQAKPEQKLLEYTHKQLWAAWTPPKTDRPSARDVRLGLVRPKSIADLPRKRPSEPVRAAPEPVPAPDQPPPEAAPRPVDVPGKADRPLSLAECIRRRQPK